MSDQKSAEAWLASERALLELIAKGAPLVRTLEALATTVEAMFEGARVSILLVDERAACLRHAAGPSLPEKYTRLIDNSPIRPEAGPCATAAALGEQVVVHDLTSDTRWPGFRPLGQAYGIRGVWSTPIKSASDRVLGTFAIYSREASSPTSLQQRQLEQFTHLASIAIEHDAAEEALRLSEQRYAMAMEAAGEGHWDWDVARDRFYASPLLLKICGLPADSIFANRDEFHARFPFHPEDRPKWVRDLDACFGGTNETLETELRIVRNGEIRWVQIRGLCLRDASAAPLRFAGSVTDVTARKHVEEELRARQEMLDLAQKAARAVAFEWRIGVADGQNRWSPDLEAMYGLEPGTYDGTYESWKKRVHPQDWPSVRAAIKRAQQTGDVSAEYRVLHKGAAVRWLQAKGRMFFDAEGSPSRMVGFMLDVTERRLAEEELHKMEAQLRQSQRLEAMGTLAGGIAHDFNNLLGAILGYGEMALRSARAGSRLRRDIDNILAAGERARALVDRILAFSRSGVGERMPVHVQRVVRETLTLMRAGIPPDIQIEERLRAGRSAVLGDPTQIHQVLMNLVTNAVHAMAAGGTLRISLDRVQVDVSRTMTVGRLSAADCIVLKVTDSGTGITPDVRERIFDPFFTTKEVGVGTGLGLSLVHGIVLGLGGAMDVVSTVGEGSTFVVYLPRFGDIPSDAGRVRPAPGVSSGARERILVVDDEPSLVNLLSETLRELGYCPVPHTSSLAALEAFRASPKEFDALITDESMPGPSGSELIRNIKAVRPELPTLLVSGYLSHAVLQAAEHAGADDVLRKPIYFQEIATALARLLQSRNGSRRSRTARRHLN